MKKFLIVGLGNKGAEYENTRHNIGFKIADALALQFQQNWETTNFGWIIKISYKGRPTFVLKPDTYMNISGKAVKFWKEKLEISTENILIITDDLHLPFGTLRLKTKGSNAGHNGLKSIEEQLKTQQYARLRFGIGNDFSEGKQVDYVLNNWNTEETEKLEERIDVFKNCILSFIFHGITNTMNTYNGK